MDEVADRNHLEHRNGVWHYRRRVPEHLIASFEKPVIRKSLRTGSIKEAQKRRNILDVEYDALFEKLRSRNQNLHTSPPPRIIKAPTPTPLSREQVKRIIGNYVEEKTSQFEGSLLRTPPETAEQKSELAWEKEWEADVLGKPDHPQEIEWVSDAFAKMFGDGRFADLSNIEAAELVRRGLLEIARREVAILSDDFASVGFDPSFTRSSAPQASFGEVAREYLNDELNKARINERKSQWADKVTKHVEFLIAFFGEDTPISEIDYDEAKRFQAALARMPSNRKKKYPKLSISQAIERAEKENARVLSPNSQARYLDFFRGVMSLATAKQLINTNPAVGMRPIKQDTLADFEKRPPFSVEQIAEIFSCEFYAQWSQSSPAPYQKSDRDWRFWLPLLLAFTGMRPGEACQMLASDIVKSPGGCWYAKVVATDDDDDDDIGAKSIKTTFSRRNIPIHPYLIEIGFLDFLTQRQGDNQYPRLFPNLKRGPRGYFSDYPCRRFREHFLPKMVIMQPRQTVYSFRHSFRDALRRIKAPGDVVSALGGWSEGTKVSDNYGNKNDPDYLYSFVEQITYPDTKLNFHYQSLP